MERKLDEHRFLPVLGPSGCGKSSVVLAGLVPGCRHRGLRMAYMTPGSDPARPPGGPSLPASPTVHHPFWSSTSSRSCLPWSTGTSSGGVFLDRLLSLAGRVPVVITMRADFLGDCAPYRSLAEALEA